LNAEIANDKAWRYTLVLLACIFSTQVATAAILKNLYVITESTFGWTAFYYIVSFFAAIPQSGLSDESGRKKHLLIASFCVLTALACLLISIVLNSKMQGFNLPYPALMALTVFPPCLLLALTGNAIPIARGFLSILKLHNFRISIGLSTACIGLGWITVDLLQLKFSSIKVLLISIFIQLIIIMLIAYSLDFKEVSQGFKKRVSTIVYSSYTWCVGMLFVTGGIAAFLAYLFSETAFYQIYILDELPKTIFKEKVNGISMGIAYFIGVISLWIINPSDKKSIKFGILFSFISILIYLCLDFFNELISNHSEIQQHVMYIKGGSQFLFSFGFGFSIPALFSLMSNNIHPDHTGRLFGAVDSTDTAALASTDLLLGKFLKVKGNNLILSSIIFTLIFLSLICYYRFIKIFKSYEKN